MLLVGAVNSWRYVLQVSSPGKSDFDMLKSVTNFSVSRLPSWETHVLSSLFKVCNLDDLSYNVLLEMTGFSSATTQILSKIEERVWVPFPTKFLCWWKIMR